LWCKECLEGKKSVEESRVDMIFFFFFCLARIKVQIVWARGKQVEFQGGADVSVKIVVVRRRRECCKKHMNEKEPRNRPPCMCVCVDRHSRKETEHEK